MLAGNVVALLSPLVFIPLLTLVSGGLDHYDWQSMMAIRQGDDAHAAESGNGQDVEGAASAEESTESNERVQAHEEEQRKLERAGRISKTMTAVMT